MKMNRICFDSDEVSTTPASAGGLIDWSASVLACLSLVNATLQPGRLRSSRFDTSATAGGPSSFRLLHEILGSRIIRRLQNLISITEFNHFAAFQVQQLICQSFKKSDRVRHDHHRMSASNETA